MEAWIVTQFPIPPGKGERYRFGIVVAPDVATARAQVIKELENQGIPVGKLEETEIGLAWWHGPDMPYGKAHLVHG